jgi:hypothetical protein
MEAGGMIAHARSSQIRNAENKYVLDDNILSNSADKVRQISDLVVSLYHKLFHILFKVFYAFLFEFS